MRFDDPDFNLMRELRNPSTHQMHELCLLAAEEIGRLRTAFRVNALRWGYKDIEIDAVLDNK